MTIPDGRRRSGLRSLRGGKGTAASATIVVCALLLVGQGLATAASSEAGPAVTRPPALPDCTISADDVLTIKVYDAPDVTGEYRVNPTGQIEIPLLSAPVEAAGLTTAQLAKVISERYSQAQIYTHPRVTVAIKESRAHSIAIVGAVKKPQIYPVFARLTLLDLLSQAEGLAEDAGSLAVVTRGDIALEVAKSQEGCGGASPSAFCASTFSVDLHRLTDTGDPLLNVDLYPGDRVTVPRAGIVYVAGAVNKPGGFPLKTGQEKMTVIQALALAEDLKATAAQSKAMIIRRNPAAKDGREEIALNLTKVLEGRQHDAQLQADDILFVPDSAGKKALRRGAEAAVTAATWGLIYR